jgi:hypothetical protein
MLDNPTIYQINTRVWLQRFVKVDRSARLEDVPDSFWEDLVSKGIEFVWLMGIWKNCESTIEKYCLEDDLVHSYHKALKDFNESDVIGSPFAIDNYEVNPKIGDENSILNLKKKLNGMGLRLILDFVPNHFSADSRLIRSKPEIFLRTNMDYYYRDSHTFYKPFENVDEVFAHGRDPFFPAWQDTIQVNYASKPAREYMIKAILKLIDLCDGIRCDMAMLPLNNVFKNTWGGVIENMGYEMPKEEFWKIAIDLAKDLRPDFLFIAEAYWDLEWELQQLGFDFTYDKELLDRIESANTQIVHDHLLAENDYQVKSVRFIENHDEERAVSKLGKDKAKAAAIIISTIKGMRFYHDGQLEGKRIRLPVQLGREPFEKPDHCIRELYDKIFSITKEEIFKKGEWSLVDVNQAWENNETYQNILAWQWKLAHEKRLVVINFSESTSQCKIKLDVKAYPEEFRITDLLHDKTFIRNSEEAYEKGIFIELGNYQSHIFSY